MKNNNNKWMFFVVLCCCCFYNVDMEELITSVVLIVHLCHITYDKYILYHDKSFFSLPFYLVNNAASSLEIMPAQN